MIETGIYFDEIHSFYDLNLILSGSEISPAEPKTTYVDIPGGDGSLDLTEAHGEVKFNDRTGKFTFTLNPEEDLSDLAFEQKKTEISNLLNGKACKITLDKDPDYYYQGRCTVDEHKQNKKIKQFVISAVVRPYKLKQTETVISVDLTDTEQTVTLSNSRKSVIPVVECTDDNTVVVFGFGTYNLSAGKHKILDFQLVEGSNIVKVSGSGTITFTYQEGDL